MQFTPTCNRPLRLHDAVSDSIEHVVHKDRDIAVAQQEINAVADCWCVAGRGEDDLAVFGGSANLFNVFEPDGLWSP